MNSRNVSECSRVRSRDTRRRRRGWRGSIKKRSNALRINSATWVTVQEQHSYMAMQHMQKIS